MTSYWVSEAILPAGMARNVRLTAAGGHWERLEVDVPAQPGDTRLPGLLLPGFTNAHSHAFHRALRGRTHTASAPGGNFWTWRANMYNIAAQLTPERYYALARATFAEMVLAGYTRVAEFHYVHHRSGGQPYEESNAMGHALAAAAADAGIHLTLLNVCYLHGGLSSSGYRDLDPLQRRFSDGSVDAFAARTRKLRADLADQSHCTVGIAAHSVRATMPEELRALAELRAELECPAHVHASEQPAEVADALAYCGRTPIGILADAGFLSADTTVVHATHLSDDDISLLADSGATVAFCPTTERDLADGIGPARALHQAGVPLSVGSDQHVHIDPFAEVQALEGHERLRSGERGHFSPTELSMVAAARAPIGTPHLSEANIAGSPGCGGSSNTSGSAFCLAVGAPADAIAVSPRSPRTAGSRGAEIMMTAAAADITDVIGAGVHHVQERRHRLGDVGNLLAEAIEELWPALS